MIRALLAIHVAGGLVAVVGWVVALLMYRQSIGLLALVGWWVVTVSGLVLLARWLPTRGRHVSGAVHDHWTRRQWISVIGHAVLLAGVALFTGLVL